VKRIRSGSNALLQNDVVKKILDPDYAKVNLIVECDHGSLS